MRIGVVNFSHELVSSSTTQESLKLFDLLSKIQPTIFLVQRDSPLEKHLAAKNKSTKIEAFDFEKSWSAVLVLKLREKIVKHKIDIIIFYNWDEAECITQAVKNLAVKLVLRENSIKRKNNINTISQFAYHRLNGFVSSSQYAAAQFQSIYLNSDHEASCAMIYNSMSVCAHSLQESYEEKNKFISDSNTFLEILHIGNIHADFGQYEALLALKHLKEKDYNFKITFLGDRIDSSYHQRLMHFIKENNMSSLVVFVEKHPNISYFYQKSQILLASFYNTQNLDVYINALAHGLTILTFENSIFQELRLLGFNVFLSDNKDQESYNKKLESISLNIKSLTRKSLDSHLMLALQYFSPQTITRNWLKYLRNILDQGKNSLGNRFNFKVS